jgi:hypothetical protein
VDRGTFLVCTSVWICDHRRGVPCHAGMPRRECFTGFLNCFPSVSVHQVDSTLPPQTSCCTWPGESTAVGLVISVASFAPWFGGELPVPQEDFQQLGDRFSKVAAERRIPHHGQLRSRLSISIPMRK